MSKPEEHLEERAIFNALYPYLSDLVYDAAIDSGVLIFRTINDLSSVYFLSPNCLLFGIRYRKKMRYILVPQHFACEVPNGFDVTSVKSEEGFVRIGLATSEEALLLVPLLRKILENLRQRYHTFGCCSRYVQCSDARKCIHPNPAFALACAYRINLERGRIFYGSNRNID